MSHSEQFDSYEMLSGSGTAPSPSADNSDDNSVSEGEQIVAITIACVFVVLLVAKLAHSMYLMRKRRLLEVGNAVVEQTEAVVDMTDVDDKVTTCEVGCQTDPVDEENTTPTHQTTDV